MKRIDRILENVQKEVELYGKSGADNVFKTNVQFTISREDFDAPASCDVEGAICDVSWFFKCAKERMIVPCGNPDTSFFIKFFGKDFVPYGSSWHLPGLLDHLKDPDTRRAVLLNSAGSEQPACVTGYQFLCSDYGVLDCIVTMRSSDVVNVLAQDLFMSGLILKEICSLSGYEPGSLTLNLGNAHVYYRDLQFTEEFLIDFGE